MIDSPCTDIKTRQFFWGLSAGIIVLSLAGAFWLMVAAVALSAAWAPQDLALFHGAVDTRGMVMGGTLSAVLALGLAVGGLGVRRKAGGFSVRDLRRPELIEGALAIQRQSRWNSAALFVGCALAGWLGAGFHREDLIWPGVALVVSLHFAPLGFMFRMRPYLVLAAAGTLVATAALLLPSSLVTPQARFELLGVCMAGLVWITAGYAILRADRLATTWAAR